MPFESNHCWKFWFNSFENKDFLKNYQKCSFFSKYWIIRNIRVSFISFKIKNVNYRFQSNEWSAWITSFIVNDLVHSLWINQFIHRVLLHSEKYLNILEIHPRLIITTGFQRLLETGRTISPYNHSSKLLNF